MTDPVLDTAALTDLYGDLVGDMREMIRALPMESAGVRERRRLIEAVSRDHYWDTIDTAKFQVLTLEVAPLMRYLSGVDLNEASFEIHCLDALASLLEGDLDGARRAAAAIRDDVIRLPVDHPDVSPQRTYVEEQCSEDWLDALDVADLLDLRRRLRPLMRHRQPEPTTVITLDLADVLQEQRWIEVGPDALTIEVTEYRRRVAERVTEMVASVPEMAKVARGEVLDDRELAELAAALAAPDLFADEKALQRAWHAPHASLLAIIRHLLDVEPLVSREQAIQAAFSAFTRDKSYMQADQITFVRLFVRRLIDAGRVDTGDLYDHPFTTLTTDPEKLLPAGDLDEMMLLATDFEVG